MAATQKFTPEELRRRRQQDAADIWERASRYRTELREIYRYFTPWREPTSERAPQHGGPSEGDKRTQYLFDSTGPSSAFAFAAHMKGDWMPSFDDFFKLEPGPLYVAPDDEARAQFVLQLQNVTKVAHGLLAKPRLAADEMFADLFGGTGAMYLSRGDRRAPIRGVAVPTAEVALGNGAWGEVERWHWKRPYAWRHLEEMWPDGKFSDKLTRAMKDKRTGEINVSQYTYWDATDEMFKLCVWCDEDLSCEFHTETLKVSPWVTPRMFVVPGEAMGRGLAHLGLPSVKTLNKARELALRAAAFALLGLWTRRNDGVFNPDTAVMAPGNFWKVAYSDGPLKTISRLDVPHNFDIASVIIKDEREQLRRVLLDDELPEMQDAVRTPTEIAGRMRRYERNRGGATTRLALELVAPMVQRTVDLMAQLRYLPKDIEVDQILLQASIAAPAAAAMRTDKVERMVNWIQIMSGLFGPQIAALNATIEDILPQMARDLGVEEKFIRQKTKAEQMKALIDAAVSAALEQQKAAEKGAPAMPPPAQAKEIAAQYSNGALQ